MTNKLIILAATGQNFANLPPLFELYQSGDKVLILESVWAHEAKRSEPLVKFLAQKGIVYRLALVPDELSEMMQKATVLCREESGRQIVIIANGNTKLFTLALYEALRDFQPALAYGEREPHMRYFAKGISQGSELLPYQHDLDLPDILIVQGQAIFRDEGRRVWFQGQKEIEFVSSPCTGRYGEDTLFTLHFHEIKYYRDCLKQGLKISDRLSFIKTHQAAKWEAMVRSSLLFVESVSVPLDVPGIDQYHREHAKEKLEAYVFIKGETFALVNLYKTLNELFRHDQKRLSEPLSAADWLLSRLTDETLLNAYARYFRALLPCYRHVKVEMPEASIQPAFNQLLQSHDPKASGSEGVNDVVLAIQVRMIEIGKSLLKWAQESDKWIHRFISQEQYEGSIGLLFEDYVTSRVLNWLNSRAPAQAIIQSVWVNTKIAGVDEKMHHSELDILLVLKNGIVIHLECKSAQATKKDLDARIANLAKLGLLARQVVCLPLYSDYCGYTAYQKMMKKFAETCLKTHIDFIPVDLPGQVAYATLKTGDMDYRAQAFEACLNKLIAPYVLK